MRERFVRGEAEATAAGGDGKIVVGVQKFCDVGGVGAHAKEHGDGFVDGSRRKLGEPGIADAPGGEGGDGEWHGGREFAADVLEERGVESVGARGGVVVDLDGCNAGDGLQVGDFCGEKSALCVGKYRKGMRE
jgi:hypothetical protein